MASKRRNNAPSQFDPIDPIDDATPEDFAGELSSEVDAAAPATPATKRCAKHAMNFPTEDEVRPRSEFYGQAKSSYCKRCMGIMHKAHRMATRPALETVMAALRQGLEHTVAQYRDLGEVARPETSEEMVTYFNDQVAQALRDYFATPRL